MKRITAITAALLMLAGCADGESSSSQTEKAVSSAAEVTLAADSSEEDGFYNGVYFQFQDGTPMLSFEKRYDRLKEKYPDKTILVWATDQEKRYEDEMNEYLISKGKDYVVCFDNILFGGLQFDAQGSPVSYSMKLDQCIAEGARYDIIDSGGIYMNLDGFGSSYQRCVSKGYFEPLDSYLTDTNQGRKLFEIMPEKFWDTLRINGKICGFDGLLTSVRYEEGFVFNTYLTEKERIDVSAFGGSFTEMLTSLIDYYKGKAFKLDLDGLLMSPAYAAGLDMVTDCVYIEDGKAKNIFENEKWIAVFDMIGEGFRNGNIYSLGEKERIDELLADTCTLAGGASVNDGRTLKKYILDMTDGYVRMPKRGSKLGSASSAVGIWSGSDNKDKAFDAIASVMSDAELLDLLHFGPDRKYEDGAVPEDTLHFTEGLDNLLVRTPLKSEGKEYTEGLRKSFEEYGTDALPEKSLDLTAVEDRIVKTNMIVSNIGVYFPSESCNDGREYLKELNRQLFDAGLQDIIDEVNKQLEG